MLASGLYIGTVAHQRFLPKRHGFRYRVFMMYLDLDELPGLFKGFKFWSYLTANIASFKREDYYGDPTKSLKNEIATLVEEATGQPLHGPIRLLTNMRYFGHCFNPVSFYYCYESDGETLQAIVSHITNTPWGEDFAYVHDCRAEQRMGVTKLGEVSIFRFDKQFHVSPFIPLDVQYEWTFKSEVSKRIIHMKNYRNGLQIFNATLILTRQEITQQTLNKVLMTYPLMTVKVITAIYWNALLLWFKRVPFYSHPSQKSYEHTTATERDADCKSKNKKSQ